MMALSAFCLPIPFSSPPLVMLLSIAYHSVSMPTRTARCCCRSLCRSLSTAFASTMSFDKCSSTAFNPAI